MPQEPTSPTPNGNGATSAPAEQAPAPRSIREIAEAAYDEITSEPGDGAHDAAEPSTGTAQPRDNLGRYAPKSAQPGEAAADEKTPATQPREDQAQQPQPHPAQGSSEAPANWSAADREAFGKLPPEGQQFLLRRHSEMEGDYQRRVQATRQAAEFTSALEPIFRDPVIAGSLRQNGLSAYQAISEWAGMHRRAMSPNVQDRVQLAFEIAARMGLDPAVFAPSRPEQLSQQDWADPAIRYFADHIGRNQSEVQALRRELQNMQTADATRRNAEAVKVSRWSIDTFADEKGADGKPLRPDFDQVLDTIIELYKANPQRDLREAYETARWMVPTTRQNLIAAERAAVERKAADQKAALAVRSNTRGITSPVSKGPAADGKPRGLRAAIEGAAEEIGL